MVARSSNQFTDQIMNDRAIQLTGAARAHASQALGEIGMKQMNAQAEGRDE